MKIIPVIDLKNGVVVYARQGQREHYQPMHSKLCPFSSIDRVIDAYLGLFPFDTFYIADLDALSGQGHHDSLIESVLNRFPKITFWVDQGCVPYQKYANNAVNYKPILASEAYVGDKVANLLAFHGNFVLSLDFRGREALGSHRVFENALLWPKDIIVMNLLHVGSELGPDFSSLSRYCQQYPDKNFIAAGGVRHVQDLYDLQHQGIHQVLMASALHSGVITSADINKLQAKKYPA